MTNVPEERHIVSSALLSRTAKSRIIIQEMGMFETHLVSARRVRRRLQQCKLSVLRPLLLLPLTMQHRERRRLWYTERQSWVQEWQNIFQWLNIVFTDKSRFYLPYSDGRIRIWRLRGDRTYPAFIRHRHRGHASCVMNWAATEYTACTSLLQIVSNLNAHWYISVILLPGVVPYLRGLPKAICKQDNARPHVVHCVNLPLYTKYSISALV